jgi:preprotein translocase subunit YajC
VTVALLVVVVLVFLVLVRAQPARETRTRDAYWSSRIAENGVRVLTRSGQAGHVASVARDHATGILVAIVRLDNGAFSQHPVAALRRVSEVSAEVISEPLRRRR